MGAARNVLPVLVELARVAGQDLSAAGLRTSSGAAALGVYTPEQTGLAGTPLGEGAASLWMDVSGYRTLTACVRIEGATGSPATINLTGTPVGPGETWGTAEQFSSPIAARSGVTGPGVYYVANTGTQALVSGTSWTGCIARRVRVEIGPIAPGALAWAYLLCLP